MRTRVVALLAPLLFAPGLAPGQALAQSSSASLSGTVTSETGQPLAGVCVDVFGEQAFTSATTGADGRYGIVELPPGEYVVAFNACEQPLDGFVSEFYDDVSGNQPPTPVVLEAGTVVTGIDAELMPGATIRGKVTADSGGRPLPGICVAAFSEQAGTFGQDRTDANGDYALTTLRGGDYQVFFSDCSAPFTFLSEIYDDLPLNGGFGGGPDGESPTLVTVADRGQVAGIDAALTEGGSVTGTVTALHTGEPVNGLCVGLLSVDGDDFAGPSGLGFSGSQPDGTPSPGEYVVPSVPAGEYVLGFNPLQFCGDDGYTVQFFDGVSDRTDAETLRVRVGEVLTGFDAVVAPRPSIAFACDTFGEPQPQVFTDVPDGNLHGPAIDCIARRGVTSGRGDGTFGPIEDVRRDQLASFVARALESLGVELPARPDDAFVDDEASVHERAINQLAALGIVSGTGAGRYDPLGTVTRGQMATFLVRSYEAATGHDLRAVRNSFTDDEGFVHERNINRAATAGLAVGRTTTLFQPLQTVNREQMATFLARLLDRVQRDAPVEQFFPGIPFSAGSTAAELARFGVTPGAAEALLSAHSR